MKALSVAMTLSLLLAVSSLQAAVVDFNTAGDLANLFNNQVTGAYQEAAGIGVGGTQGLELLSDSVTNASTLKDLAQDFSAVGSKVSTSLMFYVYSAATGGNKRTPDVGFLANNTDYLTQTNGHLALRLVRNDTVADQVRIRNNNADFGTYSIGTNLAAGNWYKLTVELTNSGAGNIAFVGGVYGCGADGLAAPSLVYSVSANVANAVLPGDSTVYAGFDVKAAEAYGRGVITAMDNLEVTPEPATMSLIGLGMAALIRRNRR